jgi:hypothetical protein
MFLMRTRGAPLPVDDEFFMLLGFTHFAPSAPRDLRKTSRFLAQFRRDVT